MKQERAGLNKYYFKYNLNGLQIDVPRDGEGAVGGGVGAESGVE